MLAQPLCVHRLVLCKPGVTVILRILAILVPNGDLLANSIAPMSTSTRLHLPQALSDYLQAAGCRNTEATLNRPKSTAVCMSLCHHCENIQFADA